MLDGNRDMNTYDFLHHEMVEEITDFLGDNEDDEPQTSAPLSYDNATWSMPSAFPNLVSASA